MGRACCSLGKQSPKGCVWSQGSGGGVISAFPSPVKLLLCLVAAEKKNRVERRANG